MDGLSSASAICGVASIAIQLGSGVNKLLKLYSAIQSAPARIATIFEDLALLSLVLAEVRTVDHEIEFNGITERVLSSCCAKITRLRDKIEKSAAHLSSSSRFRKKWSALKITLEDSEIADLRTSIHQTLAILSGAQINSLKHTNQEILSIVRSLQQSTLNINSTRTKETETTMQIVQEQGDTHIAVCLPDHMKNLRVTSFEETTRLPQNSAPPITTRTVCHRSAIKQQHPSSRKREQESAVYFFYPPRLLNKFGVSYGMQITARSTAGWQYSLSIFRAVPENAPIFEFCRDGNLSAVRTLLATGNASPWDRDPTGRTPLWVAAHSLKLDIAELLLREGADNNAVGGPYNHLPITAVQTSDCLDISPKISMIRLLQKYCGDGYEDSKILAMTGRMLLDYRIHKEISVSTAARWDAALQVVQQLMPDFGPEDPYRTMILHCAIDFYYDKDVLRWLIGNINGTLCESAPGTSCLHEAISKMLLRRDPISAKLITQKTSNLHRSCQTRTGLHTPTSLAMLQPSTFFAWKELLRDLSHDTHQFILEELQEDILVKEGWTVQGLTSLFEYAFVPYEGKKNFGFPECERCGNHGTEVGALMKVDLEWRRRLRDLRLGRVSRAISDIAIDTAGPTSVLHTSVEGALDPQLVGESSIIRSKEIVARDWPYRVVCSGDCSDGVCVAWAYENDSMDDPELPPFVSEEIFSEMAIHELPATESLREHGDECLSNKMPGAFRD